MTILDLKLCVSQYAAQVITTNIVKQRSERFNTGRCIFLVKMCRSYKVNLKRKKVQNLQAPLPQCEAFNWANRDSYSERATKMFLKLNPEVGQRFCAKEKEEEEGEEEEESLEEGEERKCLMYQMSRKSLSQTLLNFHILEELKETGYIERISFGPKVVGGNLVPKVTPIGRSGLREFLSQR